MVAKLCANGRRFAAPSPRLRKPAPILPGIKASCFRQIALLDCRGSGVTCVARGGSVNAARWLLALVLASTAFAQPYGEEYPPSEYADERLSPAAAEFYDELAPHGTWFTLPERGWVWQPNVEEVGP